LAYIHTNLPSDDSALLAADSVYTFYNYMKTVLYCRSWAVHRCKKNVNTKNKKP